MSNNLFKRIFHKALLRGKEPVDRLSDDLGSLVGVFKWKKYNVKTGAMIAHSEGKNQITNLSKSVMIRLLAQGVSNRIGEIDPTTHKITKMRFGNIYDYASYWNGTDDLKFAYLDYAEKVYRNNPTVTPGGSPFYANAGGRLSGAIASESGSDVTRTITTASLGASWAAGNSITINITDPVNFPNVINDRPPSHKTLQVNFKNGSSTTVEQITFSTEYSRSPSGNTGTQTIGSGDLVLDFSTTRLVWNETQSKWQLVLELSGTGSEIGNIVNFEIKFKIGKFNFANSVVPVVGQNEGSGDTSNRFLTGLDYYSISDANIGYSNSPVGSAVDDYKASFSVTMGPGDGNGLQGDSVPVVYTEASLYNERDDMISIIRFEPPAPYGAGTKGFAKNSLTAFFLTWEIYASL